MVRINCEITPYEFVSTDSFYCVRICYFITRYHVYSNISYLFIYLWFILPIPVVARSKMWVCGRSVAGIADSNPAGRMDVCCECCWLLARGLCVGLNIRREESYPMWYV